MSLDQEIAKKAKEISTESYAMSVGELLSLYRDHELNLHPEFQRFFRWTAPQKSRLIESLLLGIPIPPIFVSQDENGKWDVVDGLQRLSTIFELTGDLKNEKDEPVPPLVLKKTKYLPQLEGKTWGSGEPPAANELSSTTKLIIKRARIDIKIVLNKSDPSSKYELFDRLNSGGSTATDQEVRNCIAVMLNKEFFTWFSNLTKDQNFLTTLPLSDRQFQEKFHMELAARFVCLRRFPADELRNIDDLGPFLTDRIALIAQDQNFDRNGEEAAFKNTFRALANALGEDTFRKYHAGRKRTIGPPLVSLFEVLALGLGYYAQEAGALPRATLIKRVHKVIWENQRFVQGTGSGIRATSRLPITIPLGRELFAI